MLVCDTFSSSFTWEIRQNNWTELIINQKHQTLSRSDSIKRHPHSKDAEHLFNQERRRGKFLYVVADRESANHQSVLLLEGWLVCFKRSLINTAADYFHRYTWFPTPRPHKPAGEHQT